MEVFSKRNGYVSNNIQLESASEILKKRIYTSFFRAEYSRYDLFDEDTTGIEDMMIELGITYKIPDNRINREQNEQKLENAVLNSKEWYTIYDFIEKYLLICNEDKVDKMQSEFNHILEEEVSAYRILEKRLYQ